MAADYLALALVAVLSIGGGLWLWRVTGKRKRRGLPRPRRRLVEALISIPQLSEAERAELEAWDRMPAVGRERWPGDFEAIQGVPSMKGDTMTQSLNDKVAALRTDVALPDNSNWQQADSPELNEIIGLANAVLVEVLEQAKAEGMDWSEIGEGVYRGIREINARYPEADLLCSEGCATIALFFAANYDPTCYDYILYFDV